MKNTIIQLSNQIEENIISIYRHLHQYPELSFQEKETAAFIEKILQKADISYHKRIGGYGILARIDGKEKGKHVIALRADMDALPIEEKNQIKYRSKIPHVMHACGHDAHTACLLGTALIMNQIRNQFGGTILFVFQPGEERHPGGARLMLQDGLFDEIRPECMIALHTHTDIPTGTVAFGTGCIMASADEIHITVKGKGGHGAMPHLLNDTVLAASQIVISLQQVISRRKDPFIPATLSIGRFIADGATNIIPQEVQMSGTLRCMDEQERLKLRSLILQTIKHTAESYGCNCEIDMKNGYPALVNDRQITEDARNYAIELLGKEHVIPLEKRMTSEDFAFYTRIIPSTFFRLGIKGKTNLDCQGQHTPNFLIDETALKTGVKTLSWLTYRFLNKL
ncbi:M20 metallopeptidase family protein [Coprobacter sp.]